MQNIKLTSSLRNEEPDGCEIANQETAMNSTDVDAEINAEGRHC